MITLKNRNGQEMALLDLKMQTDIFWDEDLGTGESSPVREEAERVVKSILDSFVGKIERALLEHMEPC